MLEARCTEISRAVGIHLGTRHPDIILLDTHHPHVIKTITSNIANQLPVHSTFRSDWIDTTGNNCANQNHGFQGIYDSGSGAHSFQPLRVIFHATGEATTSPTRYPQRSRYEQDTESTGSLNPMRYLHRAHCDVNGYLPIPGQAASYGGGWDRPGRRAKESLQRVASARTAAREQSKCTPP
jgi:hypothetical protein